MPNIQKPGFRPVKAKGNSNVELERARVISNNTNRIRMFDCVSQAADGGYTRSSVATTAVSSVACGASYVDSTGTRREDPFLPAATTYSGTGVDALNASWLLIVADPVNVEFEASCDEAIAITDLNLNYAIVLGSTTTIYSDQELDATGRAITATLPIRVTNFVFRADNDPDAADAAVVCRINASLSNPALNNTGL